MKRLGALALAVLGVPATAAPVARADVVVPGATPIPLTLWYPAGAPRARRLPLVVISHGNGGSRTGHADTAQALAAAGFVVAAPEHPGDNYRDKSRAAAVADRPAALSLTIDFVTRDWRGGRAVDPKRIGAFGFSSGGFAVLAAAGGQPDLSLLGAHCRAKPQSSDCRLIAEHAPPVGQTFTADRRLRAVVVAAPALGFTFAHGLQTVTIPLQLWRADEDQVLPAPDYADAVRTALPRPPEFHHVPGATHFDFLAPCDAQLARAAPATCTSNPGFDRSAFHQRLNAAVVAFFRRTLR